jgi:hypothetical protein
MNLLLAAARRILSSDFTSIDLLNGELSQFNRMAGGAIVNKAYVTADALIVSGPCIYYGAECLVAGTMTSIYDNVTATGNLLLASQVGAANTFYGVAGLGKLCDNGIYANWDSGTWCVYYVEVA